jgi:hypothetical protein
MTINLQSIVSRQVPEFIRDDYPAFVEFIQLYYSYLDQYEKRNLTSLRDVDETLDSFVTYFRKELDVFGTKYPYIDERLFLRKAGQLFVSTGSELSYKFLFKVLFNKEARISYPWDQVLKPSDGKWQQETSLFVRMTVGDANSFVGNIVNIISGNAAFKVFVTRIKEVEDLVKLQAGSFTIGETYKIDSIGTTDFTLFGAADNIVGVSFIATGIGSGTGVVVKDKKLYEIFIDKNYYGNIKIGDTIDIVQAQVVFDSIRNVNAATNSIDYVSHGFQTGDGVVYNYKGGKSVGGLQNGETYYVIKLDNDRFQLAHTLKSAQNGINLNLSSPGIGIYHEFNKAVTGYVIPTTTKYTIVKAGQGFKRGDLINASAISDGKIITSKLKVTRVDANGGILALSTIQFGYGYTSNFYVLEPSKKGTAYTSGSQISIDRGVSEPYTNMYTLNDDSVIGKYTDFGYIVSPNYVEFPTDRPAYTDISYAATLIQQFYQELKTSLGSSPDFAIIQFDIGAVAKYPGQFITNDGLLDDDIYIQDSYRWQKYSYIVTVDEKLEAYKTLVKALLHPAGTQLLGEYEISNTNDIGILDGVFNVSDCEFTGSIAGDILTVSFVLEDELQIGSTLLSPTGGNDILPLTRITQFITGTGGVGTYRINKSQTLVSQDILGRRPVIAGQNVQDLGQWRSEATFVQINTSIDNIYMYPDDQGGYIRYDPWDVSYALDSELYASPETYRFWGDERNVARSTLATSTDSIETDTY